MTRLVLNPTAGAGRGARRLREALGLLRGAWPDLEVTESRSARHVTDLAREAAEAGAPRLLVAGGDGTVHHAVRGLAGTATALGVVPVGTGNDVARALGLPGDPWSAAAALVEERAASVDLGLVGERAFVCTLGVGMDTPALTRIAQSRVLRRGRLLYALATLRTTLAYRPREVVVTCGDARWEGPAMLAAVACTPTYAGGYPLAPGARLDDGALDVVVFPGRARPGRLANLARLLRGAHLGRGGVWSARAATARIEAAPGEAPLPLTLDGERTDLQTPAFVHAWPGALRALVGADHPANRPAVGAAAPAAASPGSARARSCTPGREAAAGGLAPAARAAPAERVSEARRARSAGRGSVSERSERSDPLQQARAAGRAASTHVHAGSCPSLLGQEPA